MNTDNIQPCDDYEGLKRQFTALKTIVQCQQREISIYQKRISEFRIDRVVQLEAELESQKEMNSILTAELTKIDYEKR